jgi:hypothetical protein
MSDPTQATKEKVRAELEKVKAKLRALFSKPEVRAMVARRDEELAAWQYGTAASDPIVAITEELRRVRRIDPENLKAEPGSLLAEVRKDQERELSAWLTKVKRAVDEGNVKFFEDIAKSLPKLGKPYAVSDARFFALIITREFRRAGIEPTKGDVEKEVKRFIARVETPEFGEPGEYKRAQGGVKWPKVWKSHPELATLRGGNKSKPQRLPEE